jgi:hypothetical protein
VSTSTTADPQWWLHANGSPVGPYSQAYVVLRLQSGTLSPETLACSDGGRDWRPLGEGFGQPQPPPRAELKAVEVTPPPVIDLAASQPLVPDMLKWICVFGLFVNPVVWFMSNLSCLVTGSVFHPDSPLFAIELLLMLASFGLSVASTVLLFLGALQLRLRRPVGVTLTLIGLGIDVTWGALSIVVILILVTAANADSTVVHWAPNDDSLLPLTVVTTPIFLATFVWEVVALVWLLRNSKGLSLERL